MIVQSAASATNKKSVPRKPIYFSGCFRPTSSICFSMPVTTISRKFCQREGLSSVERLRMMSFEPTASTSISTHVNTIVPLSLKNPCCQKTIWSGLRRITCLLRWGVVMFDWRARQPHHDKPRDDKSKETNDQPLPIPAPDKIKSGEDKTHPQQHTAEKPKRRMFGRNTLANRPPKAAKENRAKQKSRDQRECQNQKIIHCRPPFLPASLFLPWPPKTTHSNSQAPTRLPIAPASRHVCPDDVCPTRCRAPHRAKSARPPTSRPAPSCPGRTRHPAWISAPLVCAPPSRRFLRRESVRSSRFFLARHSCCKVAKRRRNPVSNFATAMRTLCSFSSSVKNSFSTAACNWPRSVPPIARRTDTSTSAPILTNTPSSTDTKTPPPDSAWSI